MFKRGVHTKLSGERVASENSILLHAMDVVLPPLKTARTFAAPSLKSVKQFILVGSSVAHCFLCHYSENFMTIHTSIIP